jgi:hypothetical protein
VKTIKIAARGNGAPQRPVVGGLAEPMLDGRKEG